LRTVVPGALSSASSGLKRFFSTASCWALTLYLAPPAAAVSEALRWPGDDHALQQLGVGGHALGVGGLRQAGEGRGGGDPKGLEVHGVSMQCGGRTEA
jgi:hypothetical protein